MAKNARHPLLTLTFLQLCDSLQQGVESALCALAVGRRFVVELALLLLQLGHLPEELGLQRPQTLAQQLPQLRRQGSQSRDSPGRHVGGGEAQTLLLGGREGEMTGRMDGWMDRKIGMGGWMDTCTG